MHPRARREALSPVSSQALGCKGALSLPLPRQAFPRLVHTHMYQNPLPVCACSESLGRRRRRQVAGSIAGKGALAAHSAWSGASLPIAAQPWSSGV
jgi:hypothetical protein